MWSSVFTCVLFLNKEYNWLHNITVNYSYEKRLLYGYSFVLGKSISFWYIIGTSKFERSPNCRYFFGLRNETTFFSHSYFVEVWWSDQTRDTYTSESAYLYYYSSLVIRFWYRKMQYELFTCVKVRHQNERAKRSFARKAVKKLSIS